MATAVSGVPPIARPAQSGGGRSSGLGYFAIGLIAAVAACMPLVIVAAVVPKFSEIFKDFGTQLSGLSAGLIRIGNGLATVPGIAAILLLGVLVVGVVGLAWRADWRFGLVLLLASGGWFLLSIGIIVVGLMLPLVAMIEALQKGGAV